MSKTRVSDRHIERVFLEYVLDRKARLFAACKGFYGAQANPYTNANICRAIGKAQPFFNHIADGTGTPGSWDSWGRLIKAMGFKFVIQIRDRHENVLVEYRSDHSKIKVEPQPTVKPPTIVLPSEM